MAYTSSDPAARGRHRPGRLGVVIVGMVAAVVTVGWIGYALFGGSAASTVRSRPHGSRPTVATPPERLTPVVYPTRGVYVPPIPTEPPATPSPPTEAATPTPTPMPVPTQPQRPTCLKQAPFHGWCMRHDYQPAGEADNRVTPVW